MAHSPGTLTSAWQVLCLYLIPVGGGNPAGVLLARNRGLAWGVSAFLYLISDVILACLFEPLMWGVIAAGRRSPFLARVGAAWKKSIETTTRNFGTQGGPLALILVAFGVDPMTGRTAAAAAGHGFVSGWTLAIAGDMIYFGVLMVSTLWLNGILGDETRTTFIILVAMMAVPWLVRKARGARRGPALPARD